MLYMGKHLEMTRKFVQEDKMKCKNCEEDDARDGFDFCCSYCARDYESLNPKTPEFEVCERCRGFGEHTNPAIDGNGITRSEMEELGPDFFEDYMSGVYNIRCEECNGHRVIDKNLQSERIKRIEKSEEMRELRAEAPYLFI